MQLGFTHFINLKIISGISTFFFSTTLKSLMIIKVALQGIKMKNHVDEVVQGITKMTMSDVEDCVVATATTTRFES
jgi:hypothetical protein